MLQKLARMPTLRRLVLPVLKMFGPFESTICHHWWPEFRFKLNCYRHPRVLVRRPQACVRAGSVASFTATCMQSAPADTSTLSRCLWLKD
jgi:hypothetical protein